MSDFQEFEQQINQPQREVGSILSHAFETYKNVALISAAVVFLFGVVYMILTSIFKVNASFTEMDDSGAGFDAFKTIMFSTSTLVSQAISLVLGTLFAPLFVGIIYLCHKQNTGQNVEFNDVFIGFRQNTVNILIYALIVAVIQSVAVMLCVLPALFVMPLFFLGYPVLLFENATATEALSKTFNIVKENYWTVFGVAILSAIASGLGIIACGIGFLLTYGFFYGTMYSAYLAFVGVPRQLTHNS